MRVLFVLAVVVLVPVSAIAQASMGGWDPDRIEKAQQTILKFKEEQPKLDSYFEQAYGYAVYPSVGKAAWIVGGAHGTGTVFVSDEPVGRTSLTQASIGLQFGGESFSELVFFQNEEAFNRFTSGSFKLAAKASATLITEGGSADLAYENGVAVFTMTKGGLMLDASVGGQGFSYDPGPRQQDEGETDEGGDGEGESKSQDPDEG